MKRVVLLVTIFSLLLAGCIDVELSKDLFIPEKEWKLYCEVKKAVLKHSFAFNLSSDVEDAYHFEAVNFSIQEGTKRLRVYVDVEMSYTGATTVLHTFLRYLPNLTENWTEENISEILEGRHVEVRLIYPNGSVVSKNYTKTISGDIIEILEPPSEEWKLEVEAVGVGWEEWYCDSYSVEVYAKVPT